MDIAKILGKITGGAAGTLVKDLGETIGKFNLSKEEKLEFELKLKEATDKHEQFILAQSAEIEKAYLADTANARQREIEIAKDEHTPLINKIITPILALIIVVSTFSIWGMILFRHYEPKGSESMIIGALTTICAGVVGYYFGSSSGSHAKSKQLDKIQNAK